MKIFTLFLCVLVFVLTSFAQQPNQWKGLIIDQSTPDEALKILGSTSADKTDSFRVYKIDKWLSKDIRQKKYRRLEYKTVEGFDKVILAFANDKLVFIELNPKKLDPNVMVKAYGIEFKPAFSGFNEAFSPNDFYRNNGETYAKSYPDFYHLIAVSDSTYIVSGVGNVSIGGILKKSIGGTDSGLSYPGKVEYLQIVSRKLENKEGENLLK